MINDPQEPHEEQFEDAQDIQPDAQEPDQSDGAVEVGEPVTPARLKRSRPSFSRADLLAALLLVAIIAVGAYFRHVGYNWDDYTHLHPDERFLTSVTLAIGGPLVPTGPQDEQDHQRAVCDARYPNTGGAADSIFDTQCSTYYPKNSGNGLYVYGELPLFIVKAASSLLQNVAVTQAQQIADPAARNEAIILANNITGYNGVHLVGRAMSTIAELFSIFFLYLIGRRLYNRWIGLLAAALYAAAVLPIQLSHFWTTDAFSNLPVLIAFWFATRVLDRARWYDFVGFGVGMGAAMASRINTLPLFGVVVLAAIVYALPSLDLFLAAIERKRLIRTAIIGCVLAGVVTLGTFRVTMPHAFTGGPGVLGFFNVIPYGPWLQDLGTASQLSSGSQDFPPDHQWASRTPYLFPLSNMILWGMGIPLGLAACAGVIWAIIQILRAGAIWRRHILPVVWILVYFGYMGRQWVMTMRYFMPLYPFFILMASWALYEVFNRGWRWANSNPGTVRRIVAVGGTLLLIGVVSATFLWASMFVSIYKRQLTRVEASRWVQQNLPSAVATTLTATDGRSLLVNLQVHSVAPAPVITTYDSTDVKLTQMTPTLRGTVDHVIVNHLVDPEHSGAPKRFHVGIALDADGTQIIAHGSLEKDFSASGAQGDSYSIVLDTPIALDAVKTYYFMTWSEGRLLIDRNSPEFYDFSLMTQSGESIAQVSMPSAIQTDGSTSNFAEEPLQTNFTAPLDGTIDHFELPHLLNPLKDGSKTNLQITLTDPDSHTVLARGTFSADVSSTSTSPLGEGYNIALDKTLTVKKDQNLQFEIASVDSKPVQITGSVIANEGGWDDPIPWKVCPLPADMVMTHDTPSNVDPVTCDGIDGFGGWYKGPALEISGEDDATKRNLIQTGLDQSDYYAISSNRFYDTVTRIPLRYPMSIAFYKALFGGKLGFDLVKTVTSFPSIGNFEIADQNLPTWNSPAWVNEFESEEAFSVYDHPTVFIFKKDPNYNPAVLAQVLNSVPLTTINEVTPKDEDTTLVNRITWSAKEATSSPTGFQMNDNQRLIQLQGGTWSDLFNRNWTINTTPILAVIVWWVVILLLGFAAWPILFVLLRGLPDRGYPVAKIAGMLIVAWVVWAGGTLRLLTWSQIGIALTVLALVVVGLFLAYRNRVAMREYIRLNWRHMLIIELITLILFLAFVFIRLGNPDLWAQSLGGEKPMDFAYFNAVLRSTVFPPYDPWYAGGYINYYYFGFVLVGTPVKLLGIMPSIAYNLIVPTLFALSGIAAFSVAFNVVASPWFFPREEGADGGHDTPLPARRRFALHTPPGSPYIAGTMALLLCMVLGNLDTPRTLLTGLTRAGGYSSDNVDMYLWKADQFATENKRAPNPAESAQLTAEAENPTVGDQIGFGLYDAQRLLSSLGQGTKQIISGGIIPISPDRWFWGPRSIVGELPNSSNEINEMPFFTFVFADLHAHMIALPLTLLALAWMLSEVLSAGYFVRSTLFAAATIIFGGLVVGTLQATNTWDWLTYFLLGGLSLIFAIVMRRQWLGRRTLLSWAGQLVGFFAAQAFFAWPFTAFWATSYLSNNAFQSFQGSKTPIWAYLDIHGIFLFIIVSLLIWQTVKLLRRVYVRDFIGRSWPLLILVGVIAATVLAAVFMSVFSAKIWLLTLPIPLAILCLPLFAWCAILFILPDQSREMRIVYVLAGLALAVSFGVEIVVLGADIGRQNTFFKFYFQAWVLFSIASGVALAWLFHASESWRPVLRVPWLTALGILLTIGALFPIMATEGKIAVRMAPDAPHTLDGDAYMTYATYYEGSTAVPMADDLRIIHWLQDNIKGSPTILEASQTEYKYGARIAINTGLPTIIGWNFHQRQQRTIDPLPSFVFQRVANVNAMYDSTDIPTVWNMLKFYNIEYIIQGKLEGAIYPPEGLAKFDEMVKDNLLEVVYEYNGDHIYHVIPGAAIPNLQIAAR